METFHLCSKQEKIFARDDFVCLATEAEMCVLVYRKVRDGRLLVVWKWLQSIINYFIDFRDHRPSEHTSSFILSCLLSSVSEGSTNVLMCNHNNMLLVYQDMTLKWAAQLSCVPVTVRVANFP